MARPLPYPGYTWSLTQHAVGLQPKTLYDFLKCAAPFEGQTEDYSEKITALMIASGVLTPNVRDQNPDAWRDYQQILAELGLIYSTKIVEGVWLTELGHMFLAGEIGFSELIGAQALRYQYPNGQKSTIQARLRGALDAASISTPATLTELQYSQGILLKPGTLILRVLAELYAAGHQPTLSAGECWACLFPCRTNQEWSSALAEIVTNRASNTGQSAQVDGYARRNIQDWFKLLGKSDLFDTDGRTAIELSSYSKENISHVFAICTQEEDLTSFWIPLQFDINARRGWFDWFGHLPYSSQSMFRADIANDPSYLEENYVAGLEGEEDDTSVAETSNINLQPVNLNHLGRDTELSFNDNIVELAEKLRRGAQKRHAKTLLHDRIIKELAETFISQGATVESDPNSIDLLSTWPDGQSAIFEIKTVTRRSLQGRLRTAIGQVEEYDYRRRQSGAPAADKVVVVNTELTQTSWQTDFLNQHLSIGLICKLSRDYRAFAPSSLRTQPYWIAR